VFRETYLCTLHVHQSKAVLCANKTGVGGENQTVVRIFDTFSKRQGLSMAFSLWNIIQNIKEYPDKLKFGGQSSIWVLADGWV
jgi:hypothetical protein